MNKLKLINIINEICEEKGYKAIELNIEDIDNIDLRNDIGFDSFDLAQLTVMIEDEFEIDIFEDGIVNTLGEVIKKLEK